MELKLEKKNTCTFSLQEVLDKMLADVDHGVYSSASMRCISPGILIIELINKETIKE